MKNMKRNASILLVLMIMSKVLGFVREIVLSNFYGDGLYATAYVYSSKIPNVIFGMVATGLVSTFIPMYSRVISKDGEERAKTFMDNTLTIIFFLTLTLLILGLLFTEELVRINAAGLTGEYFTTTVDFTRIALFTLLTNGVVSIFLGYHQYEERFYVQPVAGFFLNIIIITSIIVSSKTSPIVMAYGLVFAALSQLLFSGFIAITKGKYRYKATFDLKDQYLKPMLFMAAPIILGQSVAQINATINSSLASLIDQNAAANLNYASKISESIFTLFVGALTTVMYPTIIRQAASKKYDELKSTIVEIMNLISLIVIPAMIGILVLAVPVVNLFYNRGEATPEMLNSIRWALMASTVGLFGLSINDVLTRSYYSLGDTLTPVKVSIFTVALNVGLSLLFMPIFGVPAFPLATSIASTIGMLVSYYVLTKKMGGLKTKRFFKTTLKIFISSIIMGVVVYFAYALLMSTSLHGLLSLGVSIGIGVVVYIICLIVLKVEEFTDLLVLLKDKLKIGKSNA